MAKNLCVLSLLIAFTLVACAPVTQPPPIVTPGPSPLTSPLAAPQITSITYHRSGGIAGTDDTWKISADGKVSHQGQTAGTPAQLTSAQMADLVAAIRAANFTSLADSYMPDNVCCDRFQYEITVVLDGQSKTVRTIDASPNAPVELNRLVETLNRLVSSTP